MTEQAPKLVILGAAPVRIWGLDNAERLRRAFARAGVTEVLHDPEQLPRDSDLILVRADSVIEQNLIADLVARRGVLLGEGPEAGGTRRLFAAHVQNGAAEAAAELLRSGSVTQAEPLPEELILLAPTELGSAYNKSLRKRANPYALRLSRESLTAIEKKTFAASYKGATDFVTKYVWPWPARHMTRWAAQLGISPNSVTTVSLLLVILTFWLFWRGDFLLGCLAGWGMCLLDTVDGKLARVTLTASPWGNVYDHGIDLIHPPFWYWAWWVGLLAIMPETEYIALEMALWVIVVGYIIGRIMEGIFHRGFGLQTHIWRKVDSRFREITARRNPNLFLLTLATLAGRPDLGFYAVAVWTVLSLMFHAVRLLQAAWIRLRGGEVRSWLLDEA
ncbi:MAG: CDP-alcohol phosphatidyltransferase family protein [Rhodovibrionaceae bacterium]